MCCKGLEDLESQEIEQLCGVCRDVWAGPKEPATHYVLVTVLCLGEHSLPLCLALTFVELSVIMLVTEEGKEGIRVPPYAFSLFHCASHGLVVDECP